MIISRKLFSKKLTDEEKEKEKRGEKLRKGASIIAGTGAGLPTTSLNPSGGAKQSGSGNATR